MTTSIPSESPARDVLTRPRRRHARRRVSRRGLRPGARPPARRRLRRLRRPGRPSPSRSCRRPAVRRLHGRRDPVADASTGARPSRTCGTTGCGCPADRLQAADRVEVDYRNQLRPHRRRASTASSTPRTARSTSTPTSSRSRRIASSPASTSPTSRPPTSSTVTPRPTGRSCQRRPARQSSGCPTGGAATASSARRASAPTCCRWCAGHWHVVREEHDGIPLGLYARRSMARLARARGGRAVRDHAPGLRLLLASCSTSRIPFTKYDQLFVPEFNAGAMENVGAVTFHDSFLFRDPPTEPQRLDARRGRAPRAGPHVVRRPRDDALVGRPVAQRVASRPTCPSSRSTRRPASRRAGSASTASLKPFAYREDQLVTTHPIAADVARHRRGASWTSTASPTRRAPRCSSSSWRPSAGTAFRDGIRVVLPAPRLGQRHARRLPRRAG